MDAVEIRLDASLFSGDIVMRTAHRYTGEFHIELTAELAGTLVRMTPKEPGIDAQQLAERFRNDALDERLREIVRAETGPLQVALVQAALREAASPSRDRKS